jgi:predicted ATP-dependent protease
VAALVEEAVRLSGRQDRLTTRFHIIQDLVREASYWARHDKDELVRADHVLRAVREHAFRSNLPEEKWRERITRGDLLIDTEGSRVGQVNGLAAFDLGDYRFGMPVRITASVAMGRGGIIDIEREAALSGSTHTKGILILSGFLRERFAQDKPLAVSASVCFEQSYGSIDGDSASSTEIYALLSALSGLPLRQDLAVTGSVNQRGEIQVIGAVNEKIEGFFDLARARGLSGRQGVIIPRGNADDLMLRPDVVEAIEQGAFHLYAIEWIEEGIELLSGRPAGERVEDGGYAPETVFALVDQRLRSMAEGMREWTVAGSPSLG